MNLLLRDVEVDGRRIDVKVENGLVAAVGPDLDSSESRVIDGAGGALLPGLHDHHVHLLALAASLESVQCGPPHVTNLQDLGLALGGSAGEDGWVRGVGYHESVAGPLDRRALDRLVADLPVRVQHRSGSLWMLNSRALDRVGNVLDGSTDVERDERGEPTGRLWRYDTRLRAALPTTAPNLHEVGRRLHGYGLTGVTDATPDLTQGSVDLIAEGVRSRALRLEVTLLGARGLDLPPGLRGGPHKLLLRDHDLPTYDELAGLISTAHAEGTPVAVHCVTRESLLLTLAVLGDVGVLPGDRIEHAAVVPHGTADELARLGVVVVTQPGFLRTRGDAYRRDVSPDDLPCLYPYDSLRRAGVRVTASSDAPFGEVDPWRIIRNATERTTAGGEVLGADEVVDARTALNGYLTDPLDPAGRRRAVVPGAPADLCLVHAPLAEVLEEPSASQVRLVVVRGELDPGAG